MADRKPGFNRGGACTARQRQVVDLVARGLPTKEIAARLGISQTAVKKHLAHLMERYDVPNRPALVVAVIADGIVLARPAQTAVTSELHSTT